MHKSVDRLTINTVKFIRLFNLTEKITIKFRKQSQYPYERRAQSLLLCVRFNMAMTIH